MRLAHVVPVLDQAGTYGGPAAVCELLCDELAARDHQVDVVGACAPDEDPWPAVPGRGWRLHVLPGRRVAGSRQPWALLSARLLWWFARRARSLDCVHLHGVREPTSAALMLLCIATRTPFVVQAHGMVAEVEPKRAWDALCSALLRRAHVVLALTDREAEVLRQRRGCRRVVVLGNPAPPPPASTKRGHYVLACSRLHPRKRVGLFVDMARLVLGERPETPFVVVGPPEGDEGLVQDVVAAHPQSFRWVPGVPPEVARRWIAEAAVLVVTAEREPFGMTIVEALSAGTPVLGTWDLELADPLHRAGAMTTVTADAQVLAEALVGLLDGADDRSARAESGRRWVRENASVAALTDRLLGLYPAPRRPS